MKIQDIADFQPGRHDLFREFVQRISITFSCPLKRLDFPGKFGIQRCEIKTSFVGDAIKLITFIDVHPLELFSWDNYPDRAADFSELQ